MLQCPPSQTSVKHSRTPPVNVAFPYKGYMCGEDILKVTKRCRSYINAISLGIPRISIIHFS